MKKKKKNTMTERWPVSQVLIAQQFSDNLGVPIVGGEDQGCIAILLHVAVGVPFWKEWVAKKPNIKDMHGSVTELSHWDTWLWGNVASLWFEKRCQFTWYPQDPLWIVLAHGFVKQTSLP